MLSTIMILNQNLILISQQDHIIMLMRSQSQERMEEVLQKSQVIQLAPLLAARLILPIQLERKLDIQSTTLFLISVWIKTLKTLINILRMLKASMVNGSYHQQIKL